MDAETEKKRQRPSFILLLLSLLIPLLGLIFYFSRLHKQPRAEYYLWAALAGAGVTVAGRYIFPGMLARAFETLIHDVMPILLGVLSF